MLLSADLVLQRRKPEITWIVCLINASYTTVPGGSAGGGIVPGGVTPAEDSDYVFYNGEVVRIC